MTQIKAKIIAHSKSAVNGKEIVTFELEFPRLILAEFNTHNALSKNASSSRAIPVAKMLEQVRNNPAMPVRFGKKNKGMQDAGEHSEMVVVWDEETGWIKTSPQIAWMVAAQQAADFAQAFDDAGYAKQICNRLIEPFQMMKVVMTATELNNFIWLRDHPAADPTIDALAKAIKAAKEDSIAVVLKPGEWHTPYYGDGHWSEESPDSLEDALMVSSSCCAQVSFRSLNDTIEKARDVSAKLNLKGEQPDQPVHASPTEHQASPMQNVSGLYGFNNDDIPQNYWQEGVTHMDRNYKFWSGNFQSWVQYRKLIPNNCKEG